LTIVGIKRVRLRGFVGGFIGDVRFGCDICPAEKNFDVVESFFLFGGDTDDGGCLRFVTFLIVSHELTRSGNSTGSSVVFDCGIYQLFVAVWDRRILTFIFGSIVLEFDDDNDDDDRLPFTGTSIFKGVGSEISIVDETGCLNWRIRFRIAL
jgi:hypothetical protein